MQGRVGGRQDRGDASAGVGIDSESRLAGAEIVADADAVRTAAVSTIIDLRRHGRSGCRYASAGVGIELVSVSALRRA